MKCERGGAKTPVPNSCANAVSLASAESLTSVLVLGTKLHLDIQRTANLIVSRHGDRGEGREGGEGEPFDNTDDHCEKIKSIDSCCQMTCRWHPHALLSPTKCFSTTTTTTTATFPPHAYDLIRRADEARSKCFALSHQLCTSP